LRSARVVDNPKFGAMTRVDNDGDTGKLACRNAVVMDEVIVRMQNVWPVDSQLLGYLPDGVQMRPSGFIERPYSYTHFRCFGREPPRMGQAINRRLMTFRKLATRDVNGQPFQPTHIQIVDELNDSHSFQELRTISGAGYAKPRE
jgi:hypothetical protein